MSNRKSNRARLPGQPLHGSAGKPRPARKGCPPQHRYRPPRGGPGAHRGVHRR